MKDFLVQQLYAFPAKGTPSVGQKLRGKVTGLSKWGAFVDIGASWSKNTCANVLRKKMTKIKKIRRQDTGSYISFLLVVCQVFFIQCPRISTCQSNFRK